MLSAQHACLCAAPAPAPAASKVARVETLYRTDRLEPLGEALAVLQFARAQVRCSCAGQCSVQGQNGLPHRLLRLLPLSLSAWPTDRPRVRCPTAAAAGRQAGAALAAPSALPGCHPVWHRARRAGGPEKGAGKCSLQAAACCCHRG